MNRRLLIGLLSLSLLPLLPVLACTNNSTGRPTGTAGTTGAGGSSSGTAGTTATAGTNGGTAGNSGGTVGTTPSAGTNGGTAGTNAGTAGTGTAGTGTAGTNAGTAGTGTAGTNAGTAGTAAADSSQSVLQRNKHLSRDGSFLEPTLTKAMAAKMAPDTAFLANFNGGMWASPLYMQNGPGGKGVFFAVTTNNDVFALDETTGAVVWMHSIGTASSSTGAGCGDGPIGISGTPIIDATTRTLYVAGGVGQGVMRHEVHALSVDDGTEKTGWPVSVGGTKSGGNTFTPSQENQRGSLSLLNGILYVPYGGYNGDCGGYHGWVIAINTANPTQVAGWATGGQGEAIWASGGMASDGTAIFATTGNSTNGTSTHFDSEEVIRVTGMANVDTTTGRFWPPDWRNMDGGDADLGASSPVYFEMPGSTPSTLVAAVAKNGHFYLVNSKTLGGMGGSVADYVATNGPSNGGSSVRTAMASYVTPAGRYIVFNGGAPICPKGTGSIMSILVAPGSPPKPTTAFCAGPGTNTSPITTTTDGTNDVVIWFMSGGKLYAVDGDSGAAIGAGSGNCGNVRRWTSPIAANGRIIVGGDGHLCSWSVH